MWNEYNIGQPTPPTKVASVTLDDLIDAKVTYERMTHEERQHWFRSFWDTTLTEYSSESPLREPAVRVALDDVAQFWTSCIHRFEALNDLWPIKTKFLFLMWLVPEYAYKHQVPEELLTAAAINYSNHCEWKSEIGDECIERLRTGLKERREQREHC